MSVVPVKNIPTKTKEPSKRELIENDIRYAIKNKIWKFEFSGDYNYQYLATYARDCYKAIFREYRSKKINELVDKYGINRHNVSMYLKYEKSSFRVRTVTGPDRKHVYGELYPNEMLRMYADMEHDVQERLIYDYVAPIINLYVMKVSGSTRRTMYKFSHINNIISLCVRSKVKTIPLDTDKVDMIANTYMYEKFEKHGAEPDLWYQLAKEI